MDSILRSQNKKVLEEVLALNDSLAKNPELSGEEYFASKSIVKLLQKHGVDVEMPFGGEKTGFRAVAGHGEKKIAILAEYDALPQIGHGCGHSASGSISVLAFLMLKDVLPNEIELHLIGTPDEEVAGGKIRMAEQGIFEGYEYAIMIHMAGHNAVYSSFVCLDGLSIEFNGRSSHASSSPWQGRNALNAMQLFFHATDMMRQQLKPTTRIHGVITHGGDAVNVIPSYTRSEFYCRDVSRVQLDDVTNWVKEAAEAAAIATRTTATVEKLCPSLENISRNDTAEFLLTQLYEEAGLTIHYGEENLGSSDIGALDRFCPTFHPLLCVKEGIGIHTTEMADHMLSEYGHRAIEKGAMILAKFIYRTMKDSDLLSSIKKDYLRQRNEYEP